MYDEHYCPNCNSTLEYQDGFDSDRKSWICTECGTMLFGDELEETMDLYGDVVWICDSCGEILNVQTGFYDYCGTWTCTECGYENRIAEDEIYESEEAYQNRDKHKCPACGSILDDQYYFNDYEETHTCENCGAELFNNGDEYQLLYKCPKCGEILNKQYSFDADDDECECSECGTELHKDGDEYEVIHRCPNCNEILNEQYGFDTYCDEYECSACGAELYRSDDGYTYLYKCPECDEVLSEQCGFSEDDEWQCDNCGSYLEKRDTVYISSQDEDEDGEIDEDIDDIDTQPINFEPKQTSEQKHRRQQTGDSYKPSREPAYTPSRTYEPPIYSIDDFPTFEEYDARNNSQPVAEKKRESVLDKIAGVINNRKERTVGKPSYELRGKHVDQVHKYLREKGFCNFRLIPHKDICKGSCYNPGEIYYISIGNRSDFSGADTFPFNAEIDIHYHEKETLSFPYSSKQLVGREHKEVANSLLRQGFSEVYLCPMRDLILGLRKSEGIIDRVVVNGRSRYKKDMVYDFDVRIEIYYHSYIYISRKKQTK